MYSVAVIKELHGQETVVGHLPRQISMVCHLFLRKGGIIACHVTNSRQYSADLPQGGLEVPCKLIFSTKDKKLLDKTVALLQKAPRLVTGSTIQLQFLEPQHLHQNSSLAAVPPFPLLKR